MGSSEDRDISILDLLKAINSNVSNRHVVNILSREEAALKFAKDVNYSTLRGHAKKINDVLRHGEDYLHACLFDLDLEKLKILDEQDDFCKGIIDFAVDHPDRCVDILENLGDEKFNYLENRYGLSQVLSDKLKKHPFSSLEAALKVNDARFLLIVDGLGEGISINDVVFDAAFKLSDERFVMLKKYLAKGISKNASLSLDALCKLPDERVLRIRDSLIEGASQEFDTSFVLIQSLEDELIDEYFEKLMGGLYSNELKLGSVFYSIGEERFDQLVEKDLDFNLIYESMKFNSMVARDNLFNLSDKRVEKLAQKIGVGVEDFYLGLSGQVKLDHDWSFNVAKNLKFDRLEIIKDDIGSGFFSSEEYLNKALFELGSQRIDLFFDNIKEAVGEINGGHFIFNLIKNLDYCGLEKLENVLGVAISEDGCYSNELIKGLDDERFNLMYGYLGEGVSKNSSYSSWLSRRLDKDKFEKLSQYLYRGICLDYGDLFEICVKLPDKRYAVFEKMGIKDEFKRVIDQIQLDFKVLFESYIDSNSNLARLYERGMVELYVNKASLNSQSSYEFLVASSQNDFNLFGDNSSDDSKMVDKLVNKVLENMEDALKVLSDVNEKGFNLFYKPIVLGLMRQDKFDENEYDFNQERKDKIKMYKKNLQKMYGGRITTLDVDEIKGGLSPVQGGEMAVVDDEGDSSSSGKGSWFKRFLS